MRMIRLCLWLGWMGLSLVTGCDRSSPSANETSGPVQVKLLLNWKPEPEFGGFFEARDRGMYQQHQLDVTIESSTEHVIQRLAAGQAEFGILAADEVFTARASGIDVVAIFTVYQTNPQGIMSHPARGFKSLLDVMKSPGTLAVQPGLAYVDFLSRKYAPIQVKIVPYDYSITRFMADPNHSQQCFITSEPITVRQEGKEAQVFLIADSGFDPYAGMVVTRGAFLREHPEVVKRFVQATREGWHAYLEDPTQANAAMSSLNREMPLAAFTAGAEAQKSLIETPFTRENGLGAMSLERWRQLGTQLRDLGRLDKPVPAEECFLNP